MPRIDILEDDLTRATGTISTDIPFIPGFAYPYHNYRLTADTEFKSGKKYFTKVADSYTEVSATSGNPYSLNYYEATSTSFDEPIYCTSISDFEAKFGKNPYIFQSAQSISSKNIVKANDPDTSYIMAKELLALGMPVYYYAINPGVSKISIDNIIESIKISNEVLIPGCYITLSEDFNGSEIDVKLNKTLVTTDKLKLSCSNSNYTVSISSGGTSSADGYYTDLTGDTLTIQISGDAPENPLKLMLSLSYESSTSSSSDILMSSFYEKLNSYFGSEDLKDRSEYTIKYITTGGYPNFGIDDTVDLYSKMLSIAASRGDCVALVEVLNRSDRSLDKSDSSSFINMLQQSSAISNGEFGAAFTPWAEYSLTTSNSSLTTATLPACFGYLATLASNIKVSPNWLAMAGTTRGLVPNIKKLDTSKTLNNMIANSYQPTKAADGTVALNAITNIKPYGLCIWGNRTLKTIQENGLTGTNFLNIRNMISDIKKVAYRVAKSLIYEQNNETLWLNFKSQVAPFLEQLKSGSGIADYKLLKLDTHYNGSSLGKEEFACAIRIIPVYSVESFEITIVVSDADVEVQ